MVTTFSTFEHLETAFDFIDATPAHFPGRFSFCIPNDQAYKRWPNWPAAARPENGRAAAGRGLTWPECRMSGLGEAAELASVCAWGDETLISASARDLGAQALNATTLLGYSETQLVERSAWNTSPFAALDWRPAPQDPDTVTEWVISESEDGTVTYVPADLIYVGRHQRGDETALGLATTSGCAVGGSLSDAKRRAGLELLERDAIGAWWYGGQPPSIMPLDLLASEPDLAAFLQDRERTTTLFDISTAFCRHVVAAASWASDGGMVALGFAAGDNAIQTSRAATVEMLQTEIGLMQRQDIGDPLTSLWIEKAHAGMRQFQPDPAPRFAPRLPQMTYIDMTRPELGIPAARAICPGLASDKPRFGNLRLRPGHPDPNSVLPLLV